MTDTPECNALESNPLDSFDLRAWKQLAQDLERRLRDGPTEAVWQAMVYAKLGAVRNKMPPQHVAIVQDFLGALAPAAA